MSFGMAFFSITMLLGIAGFHMSDLRHLDLSSKGVTKTYYATEARVIRYYENIRLVYEIESRVRDLRRAARLREQAGGTANDPRIRHKSDNQQPKRVATRIADRARASLLWPRLRRHRSNRN